MLYNILWYRLFFNTFTPLNTKITKCNNPKNPNPLKNTQDKPAPLFYSQTTELSNPVKLYQKRHKKRTTCSGKEYRWPGIIIISNYQIFKIQSYEFKRIKKTRLYLAVHFNT